MGTASFAARESNGICGTLAKIRAVAVRRELSASLHEIWLS
jgi:hypothetical protein